MSQKHLQLPVFYGTDSNISNLDLSFANMRIIPFKGTGFRVFLKNSLAEKVFEYSSKFIMSEVKEESLYEDENIRKYIIIPVDINKPFLEDNWNHFHQLMLSIYPSDFSIIKIIHLFLNEDKYETGHKSYYGFKFTGKESFDNFMYIQPSEYRYVKNYLSKYFQSSAKLGYIKYILSTYSSSFFERNPINQFLNLIICLEVVVEGNEQLTYRLKRNIALLCGNTVEQSKKVYSNVNQLYALRSAIVHGNINPSYKNFKEYLEYLKTLVARLLRELIVHNIPSVSELNERLTVLGYGQNKFLSEGYKPSKYPRLDNIKLSYKSIQKYKP